jgi:hypothetical protein
MCNVTRPFYLKNFENSDLISLNSWWQKIEPDFILLHNFPDTPDSLIDPHGIFNQGGTNIFITVFSETQTR